MREQLCDCAARSTEVLPGARGSPHTGEPRLDHSLQPGPLRSCQALGVLLILESPGWTTVLDVTTLFNAGSVRGQAFCFDIPMLSPQFFHVPWRSCLWSVLSLSLSSPLPSPSPPCPFTADTTPITHGSAYIYVLFQQAKLESHCNTTRWGLRHGLQCQIEFIS